MYSQELTRHTQTGTFAGYMDALRWTPMGSKPILTVAEAVDFILKKEPL